MRIPTIVAAAVVAVAGVGAATLSAQADSRWQERAGGYAAPSQQAYGGHHGPRHHARGGRGENSRLFRMLDSFDANEDGRLSQEEIDITRGSRFDRFDTDGDQVLSLTEYEQLWLDAMRESMVDRFQRLDADGDAQVTANEFKRPFSKMVRRMDRNGDGVVDREDFQKRMPRPDSKG